MRFLSQTCRQLSPRLHGWVFKLFRFHILAFLNRSNLVCVFIIVFIFSVWTGNDIVTGPKAPVTGIRFHGFISYLHGNDENDHEKATYLNTQSKVDWFENATKWKRNDLKTYPCNRDLRLWLYGAIYRLNSFVSMLHYCANLKPIRYESTSLDRIVADKSHRVIVA